MGDGEIGLSQKLAKNGSVAGYFPELAVSHIIPSERLTKTYVAAVANRNGISDGYTLARRSARPVVVRLLLKGLRIALIDVLRKVKDPGGGGIRTLKSRHYLLGWFSYCLWFATRSAVREWARRPTYLDNFVPKRP